MSELRDLFSEYADIMYSDVLDSVKREPSGDEEGLGSIENDIKAEIAGIKKPETAQLFTPVRLDVQCGESRQPAKLGLRLTACYSRLFQDHRSSRTSLSGAEDMRRRNGRSTAQAHPVYQKARTNDPHGSRVAGGSRAGHLAGFEAAFPHGAIRVTKSVSLPITHHYTCFAFLDSASDLVLQFAIRPNLRNHNTLTRDKIIKGIASLVGPPHKVDLKNYELLIMVEVYQVDRSNPSVIGM